MIRAANAARKRTGQAIDWIVLPIGLVIIIMFASWPTSWWANMNEIVVTDIYTFEGGRVVKYEPTIHRPFSGDWEVFEQIRQDSGRYTTVQECYAPRSNPYRPDKSPPIPTTLDWIKGSYCHFKLGFEGFPPGIYRLCIIIRWQPVWSSAKQIEGCSNDYRRDEEFPANAARE